MLGLFMFHNPPTWNTGSLTCVHDYSYAGVYTRGMGTLIASQHNIFDSKELSQFFSCAPDAGGVRTYDLWILNEMLYQLNPFIIPFGKFGSPYLGMATTAARAALPSPTSARWVFSWFRNPPTLTWTTGSLTSVRDHSYACVYTWGLRTPTTSQHDICDSEKTLTNCSCAPDGAGGIRTSGLWIFSPTLYQLSHPVSPQQDSRNRTVDKTARRGL